MAVPKIETIKNVMQIQLLLATGMHKVTRNLHGVKDIQSFIYQKDREYFNVRSFL